MTHHLLQKWKCKWDKGVPTHTFKCIPPAFSQTLYLQHCKPTLCWEQRTFKGLSVQLQKCNSCVECFPQPPKIRCFHTDDMQT